MTRGRHESSCATAEHAPNATQDYYRHISKRSVPFGCVDVLIRQGGRSFRGTAGVYAGSDRAAGDHGERHREGKVGVERPDVGTPDDRGQRQSGFEHGEVITDAAT